MPRNVVLVGATSAVAQAVAERCRDRGDRLFLLARDPEKLERLAQSLGPAVVGVDAGDFLDTGRSAERWRRAVQALGSVDVVLLAHGDLGDQLESERDYREAERVFAVNMLSVIAFVVPIANTFEQAGRGALVAISSVAGDRGRPRNYTYGAAKGALSLYLQGVRSRLFGRGVRVVNVRLGPVDSPMTVSHEKNALFATPASVAGEILAASEGCPEDLYVPWFWRPIMATVRNLP